ncbi:prephenate dehydratase [Candidatus Spongiihabitans sp.]|uniref:prephenate dehydratase n=1 Tax=Candidatus Spongiihabitans sp. TaxID=3101308 RepID=UPI003C7A05C0
MTKETDKKLEVFRDKIDNIDVDILRLMNQRLSAAQSIAQIKATSAQPAFYRPEREAQVLSRLQNLNDGLLQDSSLESLFREIMSITRGIEAGLSVSVLGPVGTYTEAAARHHFGSAIAIVDFPTIDEIFKATETGHTNFSVVPVENSTEGGVTGTLDRLVNTSLTICGEINLQIHHNLLSIEDDPGRVKKIYAHTQSLGQCKRWIDKNCAQAELIPTSSSADAAKKSTTEKSAAAIAGAVAAQRYQLKIVAANIEDESGNTTRFLVLSNRATPPSGNDKTSLLLSCRSRPGALLHLLQPLLDGQIDMTKIESRPSKIGLWDYVFFIDILGHQEEKHVAKALTELKVEAGLFKNLGSYPASI